MNAKNLQVSYQIEIINDTKTWDKFLKAMESLKAPYGDAPWELYTKRNFDSFEEALQYYMVWYVNDSCYDIKMYEQIFMDGEMVYEEYCEPCSTTRSEMRRALTSDTYNRLQNCNRQIEELQRSNNLMSGFIKRMGKKFEDLFLQYAKETEENVQGIRAN